VNQHPPMHQLTILFTGWAAFFHSTIDGVHHSPFLFAAEHCTFSFVSVLGRFSLGPDLTQNYPIHLLIVISTPPTLVPYLLFPIDIAYFNN